MLSGGRESGRSRGGGEALVYLQKCAGGSLDCSDQENVKLPPNPAALNTSGYQDVKEINQAGRSMAIAAK